MLRLHVIGHRVAGGTGRIGRLFGSARLGAMRGLSSSVAVFLAAAAPAA